MKVLHIDSSILGEASASRALTGEIVARLRAAQAELQVTYRRPGRRAAAALLGRLAGPRR